MQDGTADGFCFVAGGWLPLICFGLFFSSGWLVSSGGSASFITLRWLSYLLKSFQQDECDLCVALHRLVVKSTTGKWAISTSSYTTRLGAIFFPFACPAWCSLLSSCLRCLYVVDSIGFFLFRRIDGYKSTRDSVRLRC